MLAIHGVWAYGALFLWAEDADGPAAAQPRPGRPSRAPRPHPFAATAESAAAAVAEYAGPVADLVLKAVDDELTLWLPATADGPLASPELIRAPENQPAAGTRRCSLTTWRVPALTFEPAAALDVLGVLGESRVHDGQAVQGGSVRYLAALAQLAGDLAARGRLLPALAADGGDVRAAGTSGAEADGGYAARWRPVLSGADAQRARELAVAMPPLCRATKAGGESSVLVLTEALDALTDAAARVSLAGQPALDPAARKARPEARSHSRCRALGRGADQHEPRLRC